MSLMLLLLGLFVFLVAMMPFGPYQLSLLAARRLKSRPLQTKTDEDQPLSMAICLSCYNEEGVIEAKLQDLYALKEATGDLEILIYVDGATDRTAEILSAHRDNITLVLSDQRHGKTHGMNRLVSMTEADIVLFTDANVRVDPEAGKHLRRYFDDPSIGCAAGYLTYINTDASSTAAVGSAYWRLDEWTKALESDTGSVMGANGPLFAVRRSMHQPVPEDLIDDLYLPLDLICRGHRVVRAPDARSFKTHTTDAKDEFQRKIRISCQCMRVHLALWPKLKSLPLWDLYKYISRRFIRWIDGYLFLLSGLLMAAALWSAFGFFTMLFVILLCAASTGIAYFLKLPPVPAIFDIISAFTGNTIGVWLALKGERFVTWELAGSARQRAKEKQS